MMTSELDYELPQELIAQHPLERRDASRLLVHDRASGETRHRRFDELPLELPEGTLVVVNDTRVLPARLRLERVEGDLLSERHARVDDLGLLVDLITSSWKSVERRLTTLERKLQTGEGAVVYRMEERRTG